MRDSRYHGPTDAFTLVNGRFGVKWGTEGRIVTMLKATNVLNHQVQPHVFGDIARLQLAAELRVGF